MIEIEKIETEKIETENSRRGLSLVLYCMLINRDDAVLGAPRICTVSCDVKMRGRAAWTAVPNHNNLEFLLCRECNAIYSQTHAQIHLHSFANRSIY